MNSLAALNGWVCLPETCLSLAGAEDLVRMGQGALGLHRRKQVQKVPTAEDALGHLLLIVNDEQLYR